MTRIVFVDDDPNVLDGLRRLLRSRRHTWDMTFATSGAAALAELEQAPADLVVSDFRMPHMDGGQLLQHVLDRWPSTARIVLSGHADEADLAAVLPIVDRFLHKPCPPSELIAVLESIVGASHRDGEVSA